MRDQREHPLDDTPADRPARILSEQYALPTPQLGVDYEVLPEDAEWMEPPVISATAQFIAPHGHHPKESEHVEAEVESESDDAAIARIEASIETQAPEILEGKLPPELAALLRETFTDVPYALGFNQSDVYTLEKAQAYMDAYGGIAMMQYGTLGQRFDLVDSVNPSFARRYAVGGHFGYDRGGRFVIAIPQLSSDVSGVGRKAPATEIDAAPIGSPRWQAGRRVPQDIIGTSEQGYRVLNPAYCAGFLDENGNWSPNTMFMQGVVI